MATKAEVEAAKAYLDEASRLARRDQPVPAIIIAGMLEAAERVRAKQAACEDADCMTDESKWLKRAEQQCAEIDAAEIEFFKQLRANQTGGGGADI